MGGLRTPRDTGGAEGRKDSSSLGAPGLVGLWGLSVGQRESAVPWPEASIVALSRLVGKEWAVAPVPGPSRLYPSSSAPCVVEGSQGMLRGVEDGGGGVRALLVSGSALALRGGCRGTLLVWCGPCPLTGGCGAGRRESGARALRRGGGPRPSPRRRRDRGGSRSPQGSSTRAAIPTKTPPAFRVVPTVRRG